MRTANFTMTIEERFEDPNSNVVSALRRAFVVTRDHDGAIVGYGETPEIARRNAENMVGMYITFGNYLPTRTRPAAGAGVNCVDYLRAYPPVKPAPISLDALSVKQGYTADGCMDPITYHVF